MNEVYEVFLRDYYKLFSALFYVYHNCDEMRIFNGEGVDKKMEDIIDNIIETVCDNHISIDDYETFEDYEVAFEEFKDKNDLNNINLREELCGYCFDNW